MSLAEIGFSRREPLTDHIERLVLHGYVTQNLTALQFHTPVRIWYSFDADEMHRFGKKTFGVDQAFARIDYIEAIEYERDGTCMIIRKDDSTTVVFGMLNNQLRSVYRSETPQYDLLAKPKNIYVEGFFDHEH